MIVSPKCTIKHLLIGADQMSQNLLAGFIGWAPDGKGKGGEERWEKEKRGGQNCREGK